jgi:hypothetical protein
VFILQLRASHDRKSMLLLFPALDALLGCTTTITTTTLQREMT